MPAVVVRRDVDDILLEWRNAFRAPVFLLGTILIASCQTHSRRYWHSSNPVAQLNRYLVLVPALDLSAWQTGPDFIHNGVLCVVDDLAEAVTIVIAVLALDDLYGSYFNSTSTSMTMG